eukprot:GEMP01041449.1.p1 GENE.GEMP01041449.1~~GEMP01041449.1.p1  ORF type:complete len:321 (+),score=53.41 GEMP01041449.1:48-1010(+)
MGGMEKLPQVSTDTISRIRWSPKDPFVLTSSWDSSLRLYDASQRATKAVIRRKAAILDCAFFGPTKAITGDLEGKLSFYDLERQAETVNAPVAHESPIRCIEVLQRQNKIYTGGWDRTVKVWDANLNKPVGSVKVGAKVFCMDACNHKVMVGCSDKTISVFDVRKFDAPVLAREPLKYQLRSLKCFTDSSGFVCGSVEGRVAWEYLDPALSSKKFAFKCHRQNINGSQIIHPVHALAFHPKGTFVTGGGDGYVCMWDGTTKKRLWRTPDFGNAITSLDFSADGLKLAIAVSYAYDQGEKAAPSPEIWIRPILPTDVVPKK